MRIIVSLLILLLLGSLISTGCQANSADAEAPIEIATGPAAESLSTMPVSPAQGDATMSPSPATPADPIASQLVDQARNDLAQKLGITVNEITVFSSQSVTWPDSSLGCPQPGMGYTQVLTPGYLILLEAGGKTYEYHTNRTTRVIFCANPKPPAPGMPGDT